jgi:hypothetical protein
VAAGAGGSTTSISSSAQSLSDLIYLGAMAAVFSYSRERESEADMLGYDRAVAAGYDKTAGPAIWNGVIAETAASDFPKVRKSEGRASVFATHPLTQDRIAALTARAGASKPPDPAAERRYRAVIRPHLAAWLQDDLRRRDFGQTLLVIDRLSELGEDNGVLEFYRGEAHRQRRAEGDAAAALAAYRTATAAPDAPAAAWRELGAALRKASDRPGAALAYRNYLEKAPDAQDRWLVEAELKTLEGTPTP